MEKVKRKFTSKQKILIIFAAVLLFAFLSGICFYRYCYYEFYGFFDGLRPAEKWILKREKYDGDELESFKFSDFPAGNTLLLINTQYTIDEDDVPALASLGGEHFVAEDIYDELMRLFDACLEATGEELLVTSSFRTAVKQEAIYAVNEFAVPPGASEHQCGLAVDVRTADEASLNFIRSAAGKWLAKNAHEYGFIIRYPYWAEDVTGVEYEPWHLRYVGKVHAEIIYRTKTVLENYASLYKDGEFYSFDGFVITHVTYADESFLFPKDAENITVSSDNMGGYFILGEIA